MKKILACSLHLVARWLPLAALFLLLTTLLAPFTPVTAQAPEPAPRSPAIERYGDITAMPVVPLPGDQAAVSSPPANQEADPDSASYLHECDPPSSDRYARMVYQRYYDFWGIAVLENCSYPYPPALQLSGNNILPRLNLGADRLTYVSDRTGNLDIFSITPDGQDDRQLTNHSAADSQPTWSPDGTMIAFVSSRGGSPQIYLMQADGSNVRQYTNNPVANLTPDWSPDGKKLAWVEAAGDSGQIVIADVASSRNQVVVTPPLPYLSSPQWARDGNAFAFEYDGDNDGFLEIGIVSVNGSGLGILRDQDPSFPYSDLLLGSWSASGSYLVYSEVEYVFINNRWYIGGGDIKKFSIISQDHHFSGVQCCGYYLYPNMQPIDAAAPVTTFDPLPLYSPAGGFPVSWTIRDKGPAPIVFLKVESRLGEAGWWSKIQWGSPTTQAPGEWKYTVTYYGNPDTTVYFRGIAGDDANRIEPRRGEYAVFTRIYQWMTKGQVVDNRGNPMAGLNLIALPNAMDELKTSITGAVTAYFASNEEAKLQASAPGFGSPQPVNLARFPVFLSALPPQSSAVTNGEFENTANPLDSWQVTGELPASVVTGHSGANAVQFGHECPLPCLSEPVDLHTEPSDRMTIKVGPDGTPHILLGDVYWTRNQQGILVQDSVLTTHEENRTNTSMAVDASGNVFFLFYEKGGLYFLAKLKDQGWQPKKLIRYSQYDDFVTAITADSLGRIHLLYKESRSLTISYEIRDAQGNFLQNIVGPFINESLQNIRIVAGADSSIHLLYPNRSDFMKTNHIQVFPDGSWQTVGILDWVARYAGITQDGTLHAIAKEEWGENNPIIYHWFRPPGGSWQQAKTYTSPKAIFTYGMAVDAVGNIHIPCSISLGGPCYLYKNMNDEDFQLIEEPVLPGYLAHVHRVIAVDAQGKIHILTEATEDPYDLATLYQTTATSSQDDQGSLSQVVSIAGSMHQPTLSFLYRFPAMQPGPNSGLSVSVTPEGGEPVTVFTSQPAPTWQHGWADLSEWAGQTVTVTFTNKQAAGESFAPVQIDEVSLGAWTTPLIESIDPTQAFFDPDSPVLVTLSGQNFMPGAQVLVDGQPVENVTWVDENHLQFSLPVALPVGFSTVSVTNPGGVQSASSLRFEVGGHIYLPVTRN